MRVADLGALGHPDHLRVLLAQSTRRPCLAPSDHCQAIAVFQVLRGSLFKWPRGPFSCCHYTSGATSRARPSASWSEAPGPRRSRGPHTLTFAKFGVARSRAHGHRPSPAGRRPGAALIDECLASPMLETGPGGAGRQDARRGYGRTPLRSAGRPTKRLSVQGASSAGATSSSGSWRVAGSWRPFSTWEFADSGSPLADCRTLPTVRAKRTAGCRAALSFVGARSPGFAFGHRQVAVGASDVPRGTRVEVPDFRQRAERCPSAYSAIRATDSGIARKAI